MERTAVSSSNILSIGYDPASYILEIEFKDGTIYQYQEVMQNEFDGLLESGSKGQYFNVNIKNRYSYTKL